MRYGALVFLLALVTGCNTPLGTKSPKVIKPTGKAVTGNEQVKAAMSDKTIDGLYADGRSWTEYYHPDGRVVLSEATGFRRGVWRTRAGQVCFEYTGEPEHCLVVYQRPDGTLEFCDVYESILYVNSYSTNIREGNAEGFALDE